MYDVIAIQCSPSDVSHIKTFHAINLFQIRVMIQNLFEKRQVFFHVVAEIMRMPPQVIHQSLLCRMRQIGQDPAHTQRLQQPTTDGNRPKKSA